RVFDFFQRFRSQSITVAAAGNYDTEFLVGKLQDLRNGKRPSFIREPPIFNEQKTGIESRKDISQVYVAMAVPSVPFVDDRRYAVNIISSALGGGMSSRLFLRLREKEGLVYNVQTFNEFFSDIGLLGIFFVTDQKNFPKCLEAIRDELLRVRYENFTEEELSIHRALIKGNFLIGLENTSTRMLRLGRSLSQLGEIPSVANVISNIESIDQESVAPLLEKLCDPTRYSIAVVGSARPDDVRRFYQ
ncbi:MAG TPA: insulinase family protein, partial [bacterium (Candidatus Stahlbacteria)]|nr:insulinase family protein [Candidatus Stahlbacteria bacterium]